MTNLFIEFDKLDKQEQHNIGIFPPPPSFTE